MHLSLVHSWDTAFSDKLWDLDLQHGPQMTEHWDKLVCAPFPLLSLKVLVFIKKESQKGLHGYSLVAVLWNILILIAFRCHLGFLGS